MKLNSVKFKFIALFLLLASFEAFGATYYINTTCVHNGNGLGEECAASASDQGAYNTRPTIAAGNTYLIKGGTTLNGGILVSGLSGSDITFGSYGTGKGKISVLRDVAGATNPANWTQESTNVWYIPIYCASGPCASDIPTFACTTSFSCHPTRLLVNDVELCKADRKTVSGSIPSYLGANTGCLNQWFYDTATGRLYWWSPNDTNPALNITSMKGSHSIGNTPPNAGSGIAIYEGVGSNLPSITIENLEFEGGIYGSIYIAGNKSSGIIIRNNVMGAYAKAGIRSDYFTSSAEGTDNILIEDNIIDSKYEKLIAPWKYEGNVGFLHGIAQYNESNNWIIRDNIFKNWSHGAIYFYCDSNCSDRGGLITKAVVENNIIKFNTSSEGGVGCEYCRGLGVDAIGASPKVTNITFKNNTIINQTARSQINGGPGILVTENVWLGTRETDVIHSNETSNRDIAQAFSSQAYAGQVIGITYSNNTVVNADGACAYFPADSVYTLTQVNVINNLFVNCSRNNNNSIIGSIYYANRAAPAANMSSNDFFNNMFWSPNGSTAVYYRTEYVTPTTVTPTESDEWASNTISDPKLVEELLPETQYGVIPKSDSPACRAGKSIDNNLDPSIGAFDCNKLYRTDVTTTRNF